MAQNKEVQSLLGSLVESYRIPRSSREYHRIKLTSTRALSDKGLQRTNQFDVRARLDGLVEKIRILNNDHTADALQVRVTEVSALDTKWTPELLSLLLLLSDRPSKLHSRKDLGPVNPNIPHKEYELGQIDDESSDEQDTELWKDVDFANDGSDEEFSLYPGSESSGRSEHDSESSHQETLDSDLAAFMVPVRKADLVSLNEGCYWKQPPTGIPEREDGSNDQVAQPLVLTELQAIREILFMLLGLRTAGYRIDTEDVLFTIRDEPAGSMQHLLQEFCSIGKELGVLRAFVANQEHVPLMQTFQSALHVRIQQLDCHFNERQTSILDTSREYVASLIDLLTDTRQQTSQLLLLTPVVRGLQLSTGAQRCFSVLEGLHSLTCSAQSQADTTAYEYAANIFFQCFYVYLHPIRQWMEHGELFERDQLLFIKREATLTSREDIWEKQYSLVKSDDGVLAAPNFLHMASTRIFNTGKSVDLLMRLGHMSDEVTSQDRETSLNFSTVCIAKDPYMLSPFAELFKAAFDHWVASKHRSSSAILRRYLADQCGLYRSLEALEVLYFCKAGNLSSAALTPIFERLDLRQRRWNDSAMITDLFRTSFKAAGCIDVERIAIDCGRPKAGDRSMAVLDRLHLAFRLPWPIANIIRPTTMSVYNQIFILLMQVQRARFLLERTTSPKVIQDTSLNRQMKLCYSLRARLLHFNNSLLAHVTAMILTVQTAEMKDRMYKAEDIDEMVAVHQSFITKIEDRCFLAAKHASLKQAIISTLDLTVVLFDTAKALRKDDADVGARSSLMAEEDDEDVSSSDDEGGGIEQSSDVLKKGQRGNGDADSRAVYEKLTRIATRYTQLHGFIAVGVSSLSKKDTALCWEVLAANLNAGLKT
ncbi:MAG: phosphoribosylformylglycinamidine synthase [Ramalina farinacea]|uniref:Spindle pole body component n=1 Tax=Ramalina farinacea TaxID=258253 RepID=A0AA43QGC4_9LECA|nr:phosphoribosylformylglycinamidine synthase [Ramalina farinacea]